MELTVGRLEVRGKLTTAMRAAIFRRMAANMTKPYRDAIRLQNVLMDKAGHAEDQGIGTAACVRAWVELERLKREMRGIPALAVHKLKEVYEARRASAKNITPSNALPPYDELDDAPTPAPVPSTPPDTTV